MKPWILAIPATWILLASTSSAQLPAPSSQLPLPDASLSSMQMTPRMWYYEQEYRRENDPRELRKARARYHAAQRQQRIASIKWYGMSNSRPQASAMPFLGTYSPRWVSNSVDPNQWPGGATSYFAVVPSYVR